MDYQELLLDLQVMYERYEGRRNLLLGHSFGSSQVMRLTGRYFPLSPHCAKVAFDKCIL